MTETRIILHGTDDLEGKLAAAKHALTGDYPPAPGDWVGMRIAGRYYSVMRNKGGSLTVRANETTVPQTEE